MGPVSEGTRAVVTAGCRPLTSAAAALTAGPQPGDVGVSSERGPARCHGTWGLQGCVGREAPHRTARGSDRRGVRTARGSGRLTVPRRPACSPLVGTEGSVCEAVSEGPGSSPRGSPVFCTRMCTRTRQARGGRSAASRRSGPPADGLLHRGLLLGPSWLRSARLFGWTAPPSGGTRTVSSSPAGGRHGCFGLGDEAGASVSAHAQASGGRTVPSPLRTHHGGHLLGRMLGARSAL